VVPMPSHKRDLSMHAARDQLVLQIKATDAMLGSNRFGYPPRYVKHGIALRCAEDNCSAGTMRMNLMVRLLREPGGYHDSPTVLRLYMM
jgi:hypothetical protein